MSPNDPLWPVYLWLLIHGGDPAPDEFTKNSLIAIAIRQIAAHVKDDASRKSLMTVSANLMKNVIAGNGVAAAGVNA